jgi:alpha-beta hydrolase superfamily lysophospholipase
MLNYGQYITDDDIESIVSRWPPQRFASFCNVVVWCAGYLGHPFTKEPFSLVRISSPLALRL